MPRRADRDASSKIEKAIAVYVLNDAAERPLHRQRIIARI